MNKAPAFQFYAADFIVGTAAMTAEDVGVYMRLLCYQWEHESLPDDERALSQLAGTRKKISSFVLSKFTKGDDGKLRNARLESERKKQADFRESRKTNARKRWDGSTSKNDARASEVHSDSTCKTDALLSPSSSSDIKRERESARPLDLAEAQEFGKSQPGWTEQVIQDWFLYRDSQGWVKNSGVPIANWRSDLTQWVHKDARDPAKKQQAKPTTSKYSW